MERDWNRGTEVETEGLTERQRHKAGRDWDRDRDKDKDIDRHRYRYSYRYTYRDTDRDRTGIHGPDRGTITETGTEGWGTQVYLRPGSTCF